MSDDYAALFEGDSPDWGDGPLFPEGVGAILGDLANPQPLAEQGGPPWTHTFLPPEPEYDDDCNPLPPKIEPHFTIERTSGDA